MHVFILLVRELCNSCYFFCCCDFAVYVIISLFRPFVRSVLFGGFFMYVALSIFSYAFVRHFFSSFVIS